ncbi:MAG: DM13 domain-containing protein [Candidatus Nitrosocosmicus sp.]|nr:DM13 domain-containing protein [Candidatus Nitrosocosmicus sp.]MDN5868839.1 DM13 domain-containing protein [Candidatus Nitrosocosmicus sp.]
MNKDGVKKIIYSAISIVVIIVIVYLVSPIFISTEINEPLPLAINAPVAFEEFSKMTEEQRIEIARNMTNEQKNKMLVQFAESGNNSTLDEFMNLTLNTDSNQLVGTATFVGVNNGIHNAEGMAKIIPISNNDSILRLENLKVTNGPDLYVYLSTDKGASDFVNLGNLKANNGNQNYNIPSGTDLSKYNTVLIWCKAFSVLFGSAEFKT